MVTEATKMVQVRLDSDLVRELDHLTVDLDIYRAQLITEVLKRALPLVRDGSWRLGEENQEVLTR